MPPERLTARELEELRRKADRADDNHSFTHWGNRGFSSGDERDSKREADRLNEEYRREKKRYEDSFKK